MTNVMHKFLIYLSIYFCLTCFGLSFSPSSEAGVQLHQWFKSAGYGVSVRARMELFHYGQGALLTSRRADILLKIPLTLALYINTTNYRISS
jgi:hypothetical protein